MLIKVFPYLDFPARGGVRLFSFLFNILIIIITFSVIMPFITGLTCNFPLLTPPLPLRLYTIYVILIKLIKPGVLTYYRYYY